MKRWINSLFSVLVLALAATGVQASGMAQPNAIAFNMLDTGYPVMVPLAPDFESKVTDNTTDIVFSPPENIALAGGLVLVTDDRPSNDGLKVISHDHTGCQHDYEVGWRS